MSYRVKNLSKIDDDDDDDDDDEDDDDEDDDDDDDGYKIFGEFDFIILILYLIILIIIIILSQLSEASLLFVDSPVGSGYSYVEYKDLYCNSTEMIAEDMITFLEIFFNSTNGEVFQV